ncbi:MAG TPA: M1 family aminopeptidase, partial [Thermodesulfovibrionales bacterium]|nr:M1 family aminopeptidase [Thermodesulfovibrionales bacterium]
EEMEGRGAVYRNQILRDYTSYVEPSEEYALTKFKSRVGPEDRAIGYGKGAYIFHMLRVMLGDEVFYDGLRYVIAHRSFKLTSWTDFRAAFEKVSGRDLGWFFRQWVEGAGAPTISLGDVRVQEHNGVYILKAEILQKERAYKLYLPILVKTDEGSLLTYHWINDHATTLEIEVASKPRSITVDPSYDLFRRLKPEEVPATIGKFMGAPSRLIVLPTKGDQERLGSYFKVASEMEGATVKTDRDVTEEDLKKNSIYLLGGAGENDLAEKILTKFPPDIEIGEETISVKGKAYNRKDSVLIAAMANLYNPESVLLFFAGDNPDYIASVGSRLFHYGKYSYLLFVKGENVEKGIWEAGKLEKKFQIIQPE